MDLKLWVSVAWEIVLATADLWLRIVERKLLTKHWDLWKVMSPCRGLIRDVMAVSNLPKD